jgi:hypothetical protein
MSSVVRGDDTPPLAVSLTCDAPRKELLARSQAHLIGAVGDAGCA